MANWRIKTNFHNQENVYPEKFDNQGEAENFLKMKIPGTLIPDLIKQGVIEIYRESTILNRDGSPIKVSTN